MQASQQHLKSIWEGDTAPKLGDELRGARYTKGVSIEEAACELRLKPAYIDAIENHDLAAFPSQAFISGYVRSYAKYLSLNVEQTLERFNCENNIHQKPLAMGQPVEREQQNSSAYGVNGGSAVKLLLVGVIGGFALVCLGYGIKALFLTPTDSVVQTPVLDDAGEPTLMYDVTEVHTFDENTASSYDSLIQSFVEAPEFRSRQDGPIASIKPRESTAFQSIGKTLKGTIQPVEVNPLQNVDLLQNAVVDASSDVNAVTSGSKFDGVTFLALQESWVKIVAAQETLFQGTLEPGAVFSVPEESMTPTALASLRITMGNAGGVYVQTSDATYGPLGKSGQVISKLKIDVDELAALAPVAKVLDTPPLQSE